MTKRSKKTWIETERQGPGRRYWFKTTQAAEDFAQSRRIGMSNESRRNGFIEGKTVWAANARKLSAEIDLILAGVDPIAAV